MEIRLRLYSFDYSIKFAPGGATSSLISLNYNGEIDSIEHYELSD